MRHCCPEDVTTMASTQQLLPSKTGVYVNKFSLCLPLVLFSQTEHRNVKREQELGNLNSDKGGMGRIRNVLKGEMTVSPPCRLWDNERFQGREATSTRSWDAAQLQAFTADWHSLTGDKDVFSH